MSAINGKASNGRKRSDEEANLTDECMAKRLKNREAARKHREKKENTLKQLEERNKALEIENSKKIQEQHELRMSIKRYIKLFQNHFHAGCKLPTELASEVRNSLSLMETSTFMDGHGVRDLETNNPSNSQSPVSPAYEHQDASGANRIRHASACQSMTSSSSYSNLNSPWPSPPETGDLVEADSFDCSMKSNVHSSATLTSPNIPVALFSGTLLKASPSSEISKMTAIQSKVCSPLNSTIQHTELAHDHVRLDTYHQIEEQQSNLTLEHQQQQLVPQNHQQQLVPQQDASDLLNNLFQSGQQIVIELNGRAITLTPEILNQLPKETVRVILLAIARQKNDTTRKSPEMVQNIECMADTQLTTSYSVSNESHMQDNHMLSISPNKVNNLQGNIPSEELFQQTQDKAVGSKSNNDEVVDREALAWSPKSELTPIGYSYIEDLNQPENPDSILNNVHSQPEHFTAPVLYSTEMNQTSASNQMLDQITYSYVTFPENSQIESSAYVSEMRRIYEQNISERSTVTVPVSPISFQTTVSSSSVQNANSLESSSTKNEGQIQTELPMSTFSDALHHPSITCAPTQVPMSTVSDTLIHPNVTCAPAILDMISNSELTPELKDQIKAYMHRGDRTTTVPQTNNVANTSSIFRSTPGEALTSNICNNVNKIPLVATAQRLANSQNNASLPTTIYR